MSSRRGPLIGAVLLVVAIGLFVVLHKGGDSSSVDTGVQRYDVKGSTIQGGPRDVTVNKGDKVKIAATANFDFALHIHGYEIEKEGKPGQTVQVSFPADVDGEFELEVHHLVNGEETSSVQLGNPPGQPVSPRRRRAAGRVALCAGALALLAPAAAQAHALVGKKDLPIPAWLFAWGASLVLIVSFFVLTYAWHEARFEERDWRPSAAWLSRLALGPATQAACGPVSVFLLGMGIWSGLYGVGTPDLNFSLTFFFVTAWLGLVVLSVLFGNVFRLLSPWRAIARAVAGVLRLFAGRAPRAPFTYPEGPGSLAGRDWRARLHLAGVGVQHAAASRPLASSPAPLRSPPWPTRSTR